MLLSTLRLVWYEKRRDRALPSLDNVLNHLQHFTKCTCSSSWNSSYKTVVPCRGPPLWSSGQSSWLQNGDVLCFLLGTSWIYTCYVEESRPPLWSSGQSSWLQNRDVLFLPWGTNWIYICCVEERRPPLWSSSQSSWLQIRRTGFHSRHYEKKLWVCNGVHSAWWVQLRSYLIEK
jgi:hypothetical protein